MKRGHLQKPDRKVSDTPDDPRDAKAVETFWEAAVRHSSLPERKAADTPYDAADPVAVAEFWKGALQHTGLAEFGRKRGERGQQ